jgi:ubiquinone/menaquinone biosynthesis C-methylase UbiE
VQTPDYTYDEFKHIGVDFDDVKEVEAFDIKQRTNPEQDRAFLSRLGVSGKDTLIDFGCGTGSLVCQAGLLCKKAHGVDVSRPMLEYAQQRCTKQGVRNVEFHHAGFLTYEHKEELLDFAVTKSALHHLPDFWKMIALQRIHAILKSGGIFYLGDGVYSFDPLEYRSALEEWINASGSDDGQSFTRTDFAMHVRDEFSTFTWILEGMLERAGFEILEKKYPAKVRARYICRKR